MRKDGTAFGVIADSTFRLTIDLTDGISINSDATFGNPIPFAVYIITGDSPQSVSVHLIFATTWFRIFLTHSKNGDSASVFSDRSDEAAPEVGIGLPSVSVVLLPRQPSP